MIWYLFILKSHEKKMQEINVTEELVNEREKDTNECNRKIS